jgi:hypothetical protein
MRACRTEPHAPAQHDEQQAPERELDALLLSGSNTSLYVAGANRV